MIPKSEFNLPQGTWADAERWIGCEFPAVEGPDVVSRADIRRRLEVFGFDCPLHYDTVVAHRQGYHDIVAPTTMLTTWTLTPYWEPGDPGPRLDEPVRMPRLQPILQVPAPGTSLFGTEVEVEYGEPVYPGDRITAVTKLVKITRRRTRVGDGAFMTFETVYRNQRGAVVGTEWLTSFRYTPEPAEEVDQ